MELKAGYKQTEIGPFPTDWLDKTISSFQPFVTSGSRGWAQYYAERGDLFVRITNMTRSSIYLDLNDSKFVRLPVTGHEGARTQLQTGDLLVSVTADIGIVSWVDESIPTPAYINQHVALARFSSAEVSSQFIAYFLAHVPSQRRFRAITDQGAKAGINLATVQEVPLVVPPTKAEQEAIAGALGDADALIESLEQLVAKKRQIKHGAMQELLTGQKRVSGFKATRWQRLRLGDAITLQRGFDLPYRFRKKGNVPIVTSAGIEGTHSEAKVRAPGVVTGRYGTIGEVFFVESDFWPLNTTLYVREFQGNDVRFISYLLRTIDFATHSGKSGVPGVNRNDLHKIALTMPSTREEQCAISAVLSDMDAEIAGLEAKLDKARLVKAGMMQELLTGRIRLV